MNTIKCIEKAFLQNWTIQTYFLLSSEILRNLQAKFSFWYLKAEQKLKLKSKRAKQLKPKNL